MTAADFEKNVYLYMDGMLDDAGVRTLNRLIRTQPELAALFVELSGQDALLTNVHADEHTLKDANRKRGRSSPRRNASPWSRRWVAAALAAAASALLVFGLWRLHSDMAGDKAVAEMRIESLLGQAYVLRAGEDGWGVERQAGEDGWGVERQAGEDGWGVERDGAPVRRLPAVAGMRLQQGDRLRTEPESAVELAAPAIGLRVRMEAVTDVTLTSLSERFFLASGRVAVEAQQQVKRRLVWETARARAEVLGTRFELEARPESSRLTVREGALDFTDLRKAVTVRVAAGQYAMVVPGGELKTVPIGTPWPANYYWDFSEEPDPAVFKVHKGKWRRATAGEWESVSGEKGVSNYLKSESDQVLALLNVPLEQLPVLVTYEQKFAQTDLSGPMDAGSAVVLNRAQACVHFPMLSGEAFSSAVRKGLVAVHRIRVRAYVTEDSVDLWQARGSAGKFERHHVFLYEGVERPRLALNFSGPLYTSHIRIQSVAADDIPDVSEWRRILDLIPSDKRVGKITFPYGRQGQKMQAVFHSPFAMTDFE